MFLNKFFIVFAIVSLVGTIFSFPFAAAGGSFSGSSRSYSYARGQAQPSWNTYYSGSQIDTYWPILGNVEDCKARQDLMLTVAPAGCQPTVVRSDLLAEQNVPVFCQVDAFKINPLIDIDQIDNIRFTGDYPEEVVGSGFHPARAALRTHDKLLGSPLVNNIGYVVIVLKKQPNEDLLPEFVEVNLSAQVEYDAGNAFGVGRAEFILEQMGDNDWERERVKQTFWNGRYSIRLEAVDADYAVVSIYSGDNKIATTRVDRGQTSQEFYVPGMYCQAGLQIAYDGYVSAEKKARIEVSAGTDSDVFDVYEGSSFLDGRCRIHSINVHNNSETGEVRGSCRGKTFVLELQPRSADSFSAFAVDGQIQDITEEGGEYTIVLPGKGTFMLDENNNLNKKPESGSGEYVRLIDADGTVTEAGNDGKEEYIKLWKAMKQYKGRIIADPTYKLGELVDGELTDKTREYFWNAINAYEEVADDYPAEKQTSVEGGRKYGELALEAAIKLAENFGMDNTEARLIERILDEYPESGNSSIYTNKLKSLYRVDSSAAGEVIEFDDRDRIVRLLDVSEPTVKPSAVLIVDNTEVTVEKQGDREELTQGNVKVGEIRLEDVNPEEVRVKAYCMESGDNGQVLSTRGRSYALREDGQAEEICGVMVRLRETKSESYAKVRILPKAQGTQTETELSVRIGIEKRLIDLTPDKALEKVENINETIHDWEEISENLGNVVTGLKGACFGTSALLMFKNFFTGLSGEALARQEVMNGEFGWRNYCKDRVGPDKEYGTMNLCYLDKASEIDADVSRIAAVYNEHNSRIQAIQSPHTTNYDIFGKSVNADKVRAALAQDARTKYGSTDINVSGLRSPWMEGTQVLDKVSVADVLKPENLEGDTAVVSTEAIRQMMLYSELRKDPSLSDEQKKNIESKMVDIAERINQNRIIQKDIADARAAEASGYPPLVQVSDVNGQAAKHMTVIPLSDKIRTETGFTDRNITHIAAVRANPGSIDIGEKGLSFEPGVYYLGLSGDPQKGDYGVQAVVSKDGEHFYDAAENVAAFSKIYGVGAIKAVDSTSYINEIKSVDRVVKYYDNEPYRGMPAIVPFDVREGWYAATRQTLPWGGGIGAFDASGRVTSFWLCNVGENGRIQFESGFGDDLCQQVNLNTGQPLGQFPGLSEGTATALVNKAVLAIEDAARQYGNNWVSIAGERFQADTTVGVPGTECQDFMSPRDCHILFNVCDPVICPASRCNFGGTYPVANVAQTGIIGSALLCLPNIREGIMIPVCLTGIQAGIDGWISIMKNYRDCLQESVDTGESVGLCDQIHSIYLCDFFWNQIAPFVNVLIPKMIELAYGQGVRGGGEYLTVNAAWKNMENSINYFTNTYAVNSLTAFQSRSSGQFGADRFGGVSFTEIGGEVCRAWVSAKAPDAFEALIEPDSPPQFHAWFDARTYTTATVPATAQYKVFYHIFAGNDQGVHFNVYLRNPPESGYYSIAPYVQVGSGFIPRGEYASETKDFTAPEGYKELCVRINDQEECGFGQVSTSFAVNYLRDTFVADEAKRADITSEVGCVSGSPNPGAILNPNIQAGVEEFVDPALYNRGIIRICATDNPGKGTDPSRFQDVGYCDDPKVRCWLDKSSVDDAIVNSEFYGVDAALDALENETVSNLRRQGEVFERGQDVAWLNELETAVANMEGDEVVTRGQEILDEIELLFGKLVFSHHKAHAIFIKGRVYDLMARGSLKADDATERGGRDPADFQDSTSSTFSTSSSDLEKAIFKTESLVGIEGIDYDDGEFYADILSELGNGFFVNSISSNLLGITALHNLPEGNERIWPHNTFEDSVQSYGYTLLDEDEERDIAIISVGGLTSSAYPKLSLGNSNNMNVGDSVYVLGHCPTCVEPERLSGEIKDIGTLSELGFEVSDEEVYYGGDYFLTDILIEAGFSGSPLMSLQDNVVGIVVLGDASTGDVGDAVVLPINEVSTSFSSELRSGSADSKYYSLSNPDVSLDNGKHILWGGDKIEPMSVYIRSNGIYVDTEGLDTIVGAVTGTGRINVPESSWSTKGIDEDVARHLRILHDKAYDDLVAGNKISG